MRRWWHKSPTYHQETKKVNSLVKENQLVIFNYYNKYIDDVMFVEKSKRFSKAFENQMHYGVFYAYLKLKEMEIKNIIWLAELVSIGVPRQLPGWNKYVLPFKYHNDEAAWLWTTDWQFKQLSSIIKFKLISILYNYNKYVKNSASIICWPIWAPISRT